MAGVWGWYLPRVCHSTLGETGIMVVVGAWYLPGMSHRLWGRTKENLCEGIVSSRNALQ